MRGDAERPKVTKFILMENGVHWLVAEIVVGK